MSQYSKNRQAIRKNEFKKTLQGTEGRKKREQHTIQIRKEKRIESFQKRRNFESEHRSIVRDDLFVCSFA